MTELTFLDWMSHIQRHMETALDKRLPSAGVVPQGLHEAMRYATLGGGKRIRPLLAFAAAETVSGATDIVETAACALECIHVYSLVHDDMPCMDDDSLRRGRPTVHVQYGEATALLVGDALQTLAFELLAVPGLYAAPARQLRALLTLAKAAGSRGMAGGQAIDLAAVGTQMTCEELEYMHIHKTGALIRAAVVLGALSGEVSDGDLERLDHYGKCVGLLFQVVDDILDATADTATLGKTAGKDAVNHKPTYVSIIGLARAKDLADELSAQAESALEPFGKDARRLRELGRYIAGRQF